TLSTSATCVDSRYSSVTAGPSTHADSLRIAFEPKSISYGKILQIYFSVAHNPPQLNYQGPDIGTQYRSAIFTTSAEQQRIAEAYIAQLDNAKVFKTPIVTDVSTLQAFYPPHAYHLYSAFLHPPHHYI